MKTKMYAFTALLLCLGFSLKAQDKTDTTNQYVVVNHGNQSEIKTLFGGEHSNGFYLGYDLGVGAFKNLQTVETGGRLAWVIDHSMALGFYGNGFVTANDVDRLINNQSTTISLAGGYGGFFMEPILLPKKPIHLSFPLMIGVGGAAYDINTYDEFTYDYYYNGQVDAFMVLRAGAEVELNMLRFFRIGMGAGYRYFYGMNLKGFGKNDLNGVTATLSLKFGKF